MKICSPGNRVAAVPCFGRAMCSAVMLLCQTANPDETDHFTASAQSNLGFHQDIQRAQRDMAIFNGCCTFIVRCFSKIEP